MKTQEDPLHEETRVCLLEVRPVQAVGFLSGF
jgi:hypothetical protein